MKTHYLVVQKGDRLGKIWELTLFQKGVTPGDSSKIWEKSRLLRLRLQESVQPYTVNSEFDTQSLKVSLKQV